MCVETEKKKKNSDCKVGGFTSTHPGTAILDSSPTQKKESTVTPPATLITTFIEVVGI